MFGFVIGDVGYGLIYTAIGYYLYASYDSETFQRMGVIAMFAGGFTTIFGVLYGEIFGLHLVSTYLWEGALGMEHAPILKGLAPAEGNWARTWFIVTALFGILHIGLAYVFEFVEELRLHGLKEAVLEVGAWLLALFGLWIFVFSTLFRGSKPDFLFEVLNSGESATFALGFGGLPTVAGWIGLGMFAVAILLFLVGPTYELVEIHVTLAHALSYLRLSAVLVAKAGMAFAANLLFFGAYAEGEGSEKEFHFMLDHGPEHVAEDYGQSAIIFDGMAHGGLGVLLGGIVVLLVAHLVVLLLGITSAGIQSIRLEYFEFFSKFYEGDGRSYSPFGRDRKYT
jgi:V/A-type H+-transporting ATPase subunit I